MPGRRLLEDRRHLVGAELRVRRPHERGRSRDLRRRERGAAGVAVDASDRAREDGARIVRQRGGGRDGAEDADAGRREGDVRAGAREARPGALDRRGRDRESAPADATRADRLEQCRRILDRVAEQVVVSDRGDEQGALRDRVVDRALLDRGGRRAAEAEVDDPRAVVDCVDDRGRLVDVRERARRRRPPARPSAGHRRRRRRSRPRSSTSRPQGRRRTCRGRSCR